MPYSFLLRRDGINQPDYQIRDGRIVISSGANAARDRIFTALSTDQGEWFLDVNDGVPYYGESGILGGKMSEAEVGAILRRRILLDPEVDRIESMVITQDAFRHVAVTSEVRLDLDDGTSETISIEV